jgi:hypothetical protein
MTVSESVTRAPIYARVRGEAGVPTQKGQWWLPG